MISTDTPVVYDTIRNTKTITLSGDKDIDPGTHALIYPTSLFSPNLLDNENRAKILIEAAFNALQDAISELNNGSNHKLSESDTDSMVSTLQGTAKEISHVGEQIHDAYAFDHEKHDISPEELDGDYQEAKKNAVDDHTVGRSIG